MLMFGVGEFCPRTEQNDEKIKRSQKKVSSLHDKIVFLHVWLMQRYIVIVHFTTAPTIGAHSCTEHRTTS